MNIQCYSLVKAPPKGPGDEAINVIVHDLCHKLALPTQGKGGWGNDKCIRLQGFCGQDLASSQQKGGEPGNEASQEKLTFKLHDASPRLPHIYLPDVIHMVNELSITFPF